MNDQEFQSQLDRLRATRPRTWDESEEKGRAALAGELWRKYGWMTVERFGAIVSAVIDRYDRRKGRDLPELSDFAECRDLVERREKPTDEAPAPMTEAQKRELHDQLYYQATRLTPKGAQAALDAGRTMKVRMPDDIQELLEQIAAAGEAPTPALLPPPAASTTGGA